MADKRLSSNFISLNDAKSICAYDFKHAYFSCKEDETRFVADNTYTYFVTINVWCYITFDLCDIYTAEGLLAIIKQRGLYATVKSFSDASQILVSGNQNLEPADLKDRALFNLVQQIVVRVCSKPAQDPTYRMAEVLQILRFPKRLTVVSSNFMYDKTIKDFMNVEKENYLFSRNENPQYVIKLMKYHVHSLFRNCAWNPLAYFDQMGAIARLNGVTQETSESKTCKLRYLAGNGLLDVYHQVPVAPAKEFDEGYWGYHCSKETRNRYWLDPTETLPRLPIHMVFPSCVPKTYKGYRVVAPERIKEVAFQYAMLDNLEAVIDSHFERLDRKEIVIHDQAQNSYLARLGSTDGTLATIDWSHASDRVKKTLVREIFPNDVALDLCNAAPTHYCADGEHVYLLSSYSTAGSPMTFAVECIVFWAMAHAACDLMGLSMSQRTISIHGDDTILPSDAAETLRDIGEALGMEFNQDKSFYNNGPGYRESCGEEYYHGISLSSRYLPRDTFDGRLNKEGKPQNINLASLLDLQHKFYDLDNTRNYMTYLIRSQFPKMTSCLPQDGGADIWDPLAVCETTMAPAYITASDGSPSIQAYNDWKEAHKHDAAYTRERHYVPNTTYVAKKCTKPCCKCSGISNASAEYIYDIWCYEKFLKDGPIYKDDLMEILRVSERRLSYSEASSSTETVFKPKFI